MAKLHQILAVEQDVRNQTQKDLTAAHHGLQKPETLKGQHRTYHPKTEDGEKFPDEGQLLQTRVPEVIQETSEILVKMFDVVATRDFGNMSAHADVVIGDTTLLKDAPATYLLWLEKKLVDLHTFVTKIPTLPADTEWDWEPNQNCYKNKREIKTTKTAKIAYPLVLYDATDKHPAQVSKETKDEIVGHWTTILYSGAIKVQEVAAMKERVEELMKVVKFAREKANQVEIPDVKVGHGVMKFIFGSMVK